MSSYSPDMKQTEVSPDQTGHEAERETSKTPAGPGSQAAASGADPAGAGDPAAALHTVTAGIRSGISPLQFMDSIDAGGQQMGNRAFMHWVGQLHEERQAGATREIAAQGLQGPGRPLTHLDTLQRAFGHHDIRGMREHTGTVAGSALDALDAEGYTRGGRMALAGAPDLFTQAHEAAHGVQQAALGERMALPGGIGMAGDPYERQADAVARAVLRGESAQPLLDQVTAGPVQVNAASASAAAPVQMRRKKNRRAGAPRPGNAPGQDLPAAEEEAQELVDFAGEAELQPPLDGGVDPQQLAAALNQLEQAAGEAANLAGQPDVQPSAGSSMDISPFEEHPDPGQFIDNPLYLSLGGDEPELQQGLADLDQVALELTDLAGELTQQQAAGGGVTDQQPGDEERDYPATIANYLFPGAQPAGDDDARGTRERYLTYFFPMVTYLYSCLKDRAGQVQTDEHGACSLRGILNMLATVMFGVMMAAPGLPLDVINNLLGGVAKVIVMLSSILGLPADWLLKLYQKKHPPTDDDRKRVTADDALVYPPRHIPEWLVSLGFSGYFQVALSQGSISPSQWVQPWTPLRISVIAGRSIADLVLVNILFGGLAKWIGKNVLMEKLGWGPTRAIVYLLSLPAIFAPVIDYIASYLLIPELSIYLTWQNINQEDGTVPYSETTATFIGYAALGMLVQYLAGILLILFLLFRIGAGNDPWRKQFYAISNKLLRYIAISLASARNAIINILALSNFAALVATNVIGPLARDFGQGGACIWPLAAAGVCGELADDFDLFNFAGSIEKGKDNLPPEHLDIIRAFPGLVGVLGLGIPIATVIALLCRKRWAGRGAAEPDRGGRGAGRRGRSRRTGHGTSWLSRRRRRAPDEDRPHLIEEGVEPGRRSDEDEGEVSPHIYSTIPSQFGTVDRRKPGSRPLPPLPPLINEEALAVHEGLSPVATSLCMTFNKMKKPYMSHVRAVVESKHDFGELSLDDANWILNWAKEHPRVEQDVQVRMLEQHATAVVEAQHSPAPSITVQPGAEPASAGLTGEEETMPDSRHGNLVSAEQLAVARRNTPGQPAGAVGFICFRITDMTPQSSLSPEYVASVIKASIKDRKITRAEAREISDWARRYLFRGAPAPRSRKDSSSSSSSSSYMRMSGPAGSTHHPALPVSAHSGSAPQPSTPASDVPGTAFHAPGQTHGSPTWTDYSPETSDTGSSSASSMQSDSTAQDIQDHIIMTTENLRSLARVEYLIESKVRGREITQAEAGEMRDSASRYIFRGASPPAPEEARGSPALTDYSPKTSEIGSSSASSMQFDPVQETYDFIINIPGLKVKEMHYVLKSRVKKGLITEDQSEYIEARVREVIVFPPETEESDE